MESKVQLIKHLQSYILNFNEYWEDPITESELVKNTLDTAEMIKSYCVVIDTYHKKNKNVYNDYDQYPKLIQQTISEIISLVSDGRDLWHKIKYEHIGADPFGISITEPREFDHHVQANGHLDYENDPFTRNYRIIQICNDLITICTSEKKLSDGVDFSPIIKSGIFYDFEGYESGSMNVKFDKININDKDILFDGRIIYYTTFDSHTVHDPGVVVMDVTDYNISYLPYMDGDDFFDDEGEFDAKELYNCIIKHKQLNIEDVIESAKKAIECHIRNRY